MAQKPVAAKQEKRIYFALAFALMQLAFGFWFVLLCCCCWWFGASRVESQVSWATGQTRPFAICRRSSCARQPENKFHQFTRCNCKRCLAKRVALLQQTRGELEIHNASGRSRTTELRPTSVHYATTLRVRPLLLLLLVVVGWGQSVTVAANCALQLIHADARGSLRVVVVAVATTPPERVHPAA